MGLRTMAYADPPYPGQAKQYRAHHDYAGEVDHAELIDRLERDYPDGWALSTGAKNLPAVLRLCPESVRVLIWRKQPGVPFGDNFLWCFEPVILRAAHRPRVRVADVCEATPPGLLLTFQRRPGEHVVGAKPEEFCLWLFRAMGLRADDELHDLFPGSGAVARAWARYTTQMELAA